MLADMQPENTRSLYQNDVLRLAKKLNSYTAQVQSFRLPDLPIDQDKQAENPSLIQLAIECLRGVETPHSVPPLEASGRWTLLLEAEFAYEQDRAANRPVNPATVALSTMLAAYARNDVTTFNKQLADFRRILAEYEQSLIANADQLDQVGVKKAEILSHAESISRYSTTNSAHSITRQCCTSWRLCWARCRGWAGPSRCDGRR